MRFEKFIAGRYLKAKHKVNFITIISFISISGITLGVAALIVVLSVFNGFNSLVTSFLVSLDPHLRIEKIDSEFEYENNKLDSTLKKLGTIRVNSPYVSGKVLAYNKEKYQVVNLKGIIPENGEDIYNLKTTNAYGEYNLLSDDIPKVVIGLGLADELHLYPGDTISIISPSGIEEAISQMSLTSTMDFVVSGIFISNNNEYDRSYIFTDLESAEDLLGIPENMEGREIKLTNIEEANDVKELLQKSLPAKYYSINTWYDFHKDLYAVMQIERWAAYIILSMIIAVASFNILSSLTMSVIEKKRDIGILRTMGANEKSIIKIFMFEGLLVGIIGTILGSILGYGICLIHIFYNIYPLDPSQYKITALPLEIRVSDFFIVAASSMLLAFFAALYPAKRAANVNALEAIKWE